MPRHLHPHGAAFIILLLFAVFEGQAQSFGEAGSYGAKPGSELASGANTNLATGVISPSIPLISLPGVSGGVTVGLQYQAGAGVKVNAVASELGLGWALTGGGAIVRDVKGFADDSEYGWFIDLGTIHSYRGRYWQNAAPNLTLLPLRTAGDVVKYFKSRTGNVDYTPGGARVYGAGTHEDTNLRTWLYPASQASNYGQYRPDNTISANNPNTLGNVEARWLGVFMPDNEPDVYTLMLPSGTLQFVFDPSGNPVPLQAQNIKIEPLNLGTRTYNANGLLHEFRVTTSDGVKYHFGSPAGTSDFKESITVTTRVLEMPSLGSKNDQPAYINKWHLRKIVYPSGEEINYAYSSNKTYEITTNNYLQQDWVYTTFGGTIVSNRNKPWGRTPSDPFFGPSPWKRRYTVRNSVSSNDTKQLVSISSPRGSLQFSYQSPVRKDVGGNTNALSRIRLLNSQGALIKQLELVQHYADYGQLVPNAMPYDRYHLLLDRVVDKGAGCDYTQLWQFGYDPRTFCRNAATKDDWGYLNALIYPADNVLVGAYARPVVFNHSFSLAGRNRDPNADFTQYMVLRTITAATGAVQSFAYELNDHYPIGQTNNSGFVNRSIGGLRIKQITKYDGVTHSNDLVDEFTYRKATNANESSGCWGDAGLYAKLQIIHDYMPYGTAQRDFNSDDEMRRTLPDCIASNYQGDWGDSYYLLRSDASMYQYAADYLDYSCVTVSHGAKGKTRHEFTNWSETSHRDYTDADTREVGSNVNTCPYDPLRPANRGAVVSLPFSLALDAVNLLYTDGITADFPNRSSRSAERGLVFRTTQLTNSDVAVAATVNEYDFSRSGISLPTVSALYAKPSLETFGFSQFFTYFHLYYYNVASQWCPLIASTEIVYNQQSGGDITKSAATKTVLEYENFFPRKITKFTVAYTGPMAFTAPGPIYVTEFRRAQSPAFADGTPGGTADQVTTAGLLRNAGMTAPVIEQEQYTATTSNVLLTHQGASLTVFQVNNGHVVPYQSYALPAGASFTPATTTQSGGVWTLVRDADYQLVSTVTGYNADALPVNSIGRDGVSQATIWGYGRTLPIASVANGTATTGTSGTGLNGTAGHTSFEESGVDGDGWLPPPNRSTQAKTGAFSAQYNRSQNPYGLNKTLVLLPASRHGKMLFSCWAKVPAGSPAVEFKLVASRHGVGSQASPNFQVAPGLDWQYKEFAIDLDDPVWGSPGASIEVLHYLWMLSGETLLLDEMRLHPADAQMQTTTYQPLVGKTSVTGADGRTSYFTYDADNAPHLVLNHNRDVLTRTQSKVVNQARLSAGFAPEYGIAQMPVNFAAELSNCQDGTTFRWDFGDQSAPATGATPAHTYSVPGTYQVSLIASHPQKGVAKLTKAVPICGAYSTAIDVLQGDLYVDCCANTGNGAVSLSAYVSSGQCQQAATYQWQQQTSSNGPWNNLAGATSADFFFQVPCGATVSYQCLIVATDGSTNEYDPSIPVITATGSNTTGGVQCLASPGPLLNRF